MLIVQPRECRNANKPMHNKSVNGTHRCKLGTKRHNNFGKGYRASRRGCAEIGRVTNKNRFIYDANIN